MTGSRKVILELVNAFRHSAANDSVRIGSRSNSYAI
jgi:hypothetical protein